jgi:hypothetical protein
MVELADEMDGAVEGEEVAMAMVADLHQVAAVEAVAVEDVEFPVGEFGLLGPVVRHGVDPHIDPAGLRCRSRSPGRGSGRNPLMSSPLFGRC